jgi:hypothetical protein
MKHHHSYDSKTIYGCDKLLLDGLIARDLQVEIKPVFIHLEGIGTEYEDEDGKINSAVYSLTEDALERKAAKEIGSRRAKVLIDFIDECRRFIETTG